ncbi:jg9261 [Pararge aegeria aegeria]|uniref:Jg9261 protein n=1 Tax=Pararge aegeria aegeria TaxID=348720 RepID=A0A8S4SGB0_9NEOP|nr:jg9261 [Pararge aegeria aegeria]
MDILHWHSALWFVVMLIWPGKFAKSERSFTGVNTLIREYIGRTTTEKLGATLMGDGVLMVYPDRTKQSSVQQDSKRLVQQDSKSLVQQNSNIQTSKHTLQQEIHSTVQHGTRLSAKLINISNNPTDNPPINAVQFTAQPQGLKVTPLPLAGSDHELSFNVSWDPPSSPTVQAYSLEVHSASNTLDCRLLNFCYESNIPGDSLWSVIPSYPSPDADGCAVKPGCAYLVKLIASPWDGHTYADLHVELDECVGGVCSCAHAPRLPAPVVSASTISIQGELFVNVSWSLPVPMEPLRLPPRLRKEYYFIRTSCKTVAQKRATRDRSSAEGNRELYYIMDADRKPRFFHAFTLALWAAFGGTCVLAMVAILAFSARAVKRVLKEFRPEPVPAALQPLRPRPNWFPFDG